MAEKSVNIVQLKAFIEAVEFAADTDNWIPSERQWRRIRDMIERLEETTPAPQAVQMPPIQPPVTQMAPPGLGGMMPPIHTMPVAPQQLPGPFAMGSPHVPVRSPDIDTSNGQYVSAFT